MYEAFGLEANSTASLIPRSLCVDGSEQCPNLVLIICCCLCQIKTYTTEISHNRN